VDLLHLAVEIAGRLAELLALPLVHVRPDDMAVRAVKFGVDIHQRLHVVVSGGHFLQAMQGIAQGVAADAGGLTRGKRGHIGAEEWSLLFKRTDLVAQIGTPGSADDYVYPTGERLRMDLGRNRNFEAGTNLRA
jgi:hypothetical protein